MIIQKQTSEDIDVIALLAKCAMAVNESIIKHYKMLLKGLLMGVAAGAVFYFVCPKRYSSRLIIQSGILTESYAANIAQNLKELLKEENYLEVARKLGMTKDEASRIFSIEIQTIEGKKGTPKDGELVNAFLVTVQIFNNAVLPKLQRGILSLLSNNEYVKIREQQRRRYCEGMIAEMDKELASINSMKQMLFARKSKSFDAFLMDPTSIYKVSVELSKEKIGYQNQLELADSVQLVEGFTTYKKPFSPRLIFSLLTGALFGLGAVLIIFACKALSALFEFSEKKLAQARPPEAKIRLNSRVKDFA